jgi:hypothetical protein
MKDEEVEPIKLGRVPPFIDEDYKTGLDKAGRYMFVNQQ